MALSEQQAQAIRALLTKKMESKLKAYGRETTAMPFLARLIQDSEKISAYSFIHSIATSLGMSIYEQVSVLIAAGRGYECARNYGVGGEGCRFMCTWLSLTTPTTRSRIPAMPNRG